MGEKKCLIHVYDKGEPFGSQLPKKFNKFSTQERRTYVGDIVHKAKKKETSSPSPHDYDPHAKKPKPLGNYKQSSPKITFAQEVEFLFGSNPMPGKYEAMHLDKLKSKPRYTKIYDTPRFEKDKGDKGPSPLSYDVVGAIAASQWKKQNPKISTFGSQSRKSIFAEMAHRNKSPGVGAYHGGIEKAWTSERNGMSRSPSLKKARH